MYAQRWAAVLSGPPCNRMADARVSVLMPLGRIDEFTLPAIQSTLDQQDVELELIIVGPRELDDVDDVCKRFFQPLQIHDSRIRYIQRHQPGIANALNCALKAANGTYIARMDADDISEPNRLKHQLALARIHNNQCLVSACVEIFSNTQIIKAGNQHYQAWLNEQRSMEVIRNACFIESPLPHPTWFAHRSIWEQIGPYQQGDFPEDYDFVLRAWLAGIPMSKPKPPLLRWREHSNRLTRTDPRYRREAFTQLKARAVTDKRSGYGVHEARPIWIAGTGRNARYWHDALESNKANVAGFVDLNTANAKHQKRHKPVIRYDDLARDHREALLITAITAPSARKQLIAWCQANQRQVGVDVVIGG